MPKSISHSRSSSNGEDLRYNEVLFACWEPFYKDFEFQDVVTQAKAILSKEDYDAIRNEKDEERRLMRLFWILKDDEKTLKDFLRALSHYFKWLVDFVERERSTPSMDTLKYLEALRAISIQLHKHIDYNVHRMEPYMELRGALLKLRPRNYVMLCGELGAGKKWLTYDVCSDFRVLKAMDFKVFWLDLSQCTRPEEDLRMLRHFKKLLEHYSPYGMQPSPTPSSNTSDAVGQISYRHQVDIAESIPNSILSIQLEIKKTLLSADDNKNCLLVLMNVPNKKAWSAFNLGCKMLILTRNTKLRDTLSPKLCKHIDLRGELTVPEFFRLFENYTKTDRSRFPKNCIALYEKSEKNPYLLSLIAQGIKRENNWEEWLDNLQNSNINMNKFNTVIELSLHNLSPYYKECYMKCAIFPHSVGIPVKLLAHLWKTSAKEAEEILNYLVNFSMISKRSWDDNSITYELPFIYSLYFKNMGREFVDLHEKVLDYYNLSECLTNGLSSSQLDWYFYNSVGYHLKEAGYLEWFPKLFLDFAFLEQLIREITLLNTIGILIDYESYIINGDKGKLQLLRAIKEFLPKVQDKLLYSQDTCLLQYALMETGRIKEEALRQVRKFPHNVWFEDKGKFHQRRQIFPLESQARQVVLLEEELVLSVLENNDIVLSDISLDYNKDPILIATDHRPDAKVIDVYLFRENNFVLILNDYGELNLWSIEEEHQRSIVRRRNSKKKVYAQNFRKYVTKGDTGRWKQRVNAVIRGNSKIVAFVLKSERYLHLALADGKVYLLEWNADKAEFQLSSLCVPPLITRENGIRVLALISYTHYMMLTNAGEVTFWCLKDSSKVCVYSDWFAKDDEFVCHEMTTDLGESNIHVTFVFKRKVVRLVIPSPEHISKTKLVPQVLYELDDSSNEITCGRVTRNSQYIVLGTKQGLVVFDAFIKAEILRGNVSEDIACVDIYTLDDPSFKYIIVCGTQDKKALYINGLRLNHDGFTLAWAHDVNQTISDERSFEPTLEPNVRLGGHRKFDLLTYADRGCDLLAADTKNRIHQVRLDDASAWSLINPMKAEATPKRGAQKTKMEAISSISCYKENAFAAYENGHLFNISKEEFQRDFMPSAITMLKVIDDSYLVASTNSLTTIYNYVGKHKVSVPLGCKYCVKVSDKHVVMIMNNADGLLLNLENHSDYKSFHFALGATVGGCDYKNGCLYVALQTHEIHVFQFNAGADKALAVAQIYPNPKSNQHFQEIDEDPQKLSERLSNVRCLAASSNGELISFGLQNGAIKLYKFNAAHGLLQEVFVMRSHETAVNDLLFSPDGRVLISCGNQMCFWNVHHMLNNPLVRHEKRRGSTRFSSQYSSDAEDTDCAVGVKRLTIPKMAGGGYDNGYLGDSFADLKVRDHNGNGSASSEQPFDWQDCQGLTRKPELYACIKFDGNNAERIIANPEFTEFRTIDDEGVYYNLSLLANWHAEESAVACSDHEDRENYVNGNCTLVYERHDDTDTVFT